MENPNPFPEMKVVKLPPPFEGIARAIAKIKTLGSEVEMCLTEHPHKDNDGGVQPPLF